MNGDGSDVIQILNNIVNQMISGKRKIKFDLDIESIENENIKSLASKIVAMAAQFTECYGFILDLACGRLNCEPPSRTNAFASPFKQLHSDLRHLTWQIQQIADGDYDQSVSFSGDFSDAINKMIGALRERQVLAERIKEDENLFRSIFSTSPDGIILCDLAQNIVKASNAAFRMLMTSEEITGNTQYEDFIYHEDISTYKWLITSQLTSDSPTSSAELRIKRNDGEVIWTEQNVSMLLDSNSDPKGYIIILRDISERKAAEEQLLQYTDEVNESIRNKDKLFSIVSHDLKSPFSALLGTCKAMEQEFDKEEVNLERIKRYSKILNDSASRTYCLLINLLDWARLQADRIELNPEWINLSEIVTDNVNISLTAAMGKNITLHFAAPGEYPVLSDKAIINTILRNLISNAIKYTPQNGEVIVSVVQSEQLYVISVQDNGLGIPEDKLEKLFKKDTIESTPGTANEKGTGLGLGLCKDFVNKIGGEIWVDSVYGEGAIFSFTVKDIL